ncbi:hypothetical protein [Pseudomonas putida]|uniref:Uncharacterized protein n=1 Tax=Pseudomonas putida TaxID=303 RepID=A0A1Q9R7B6_PSEPU|nr:hypothetical protein [Pseudomonas putida]OLS63330.1 hypothetical protein PSEMO_14690 [Pseudomonas putida]
MESRASLDDMLEWLRGGSRTGGFNCIVAYDRTKTNTVLLQEYIERFTAGTYLKPINMDVPTSGKTRELTYDYILDAGRLSFENASIDKSEARLTMHVIGGSQVSLEESDSGQLKVAGISSIDALQGPLVYMDIKLKGTEGVISEDGKIYLNLKDDFEVIMLTFAATDRERAIGGEFLNDYFKDLPEDQQIHVLNEIKVNPDQYLVHQEFFIRTHAAPGGKDPHSANRGAGAVLVFITTLGQDNGKIAVKDEDQPYLIPDGFSASMLLGHDFLMAKIFSEGCRALADQGSEYDFELVSYQEGIIDHMRVLRGVVSGPEITGSSATFKEITAGLLAFPLANNDVVMTCKFSDGRITLDWKGFSQFRLGVLPQYGQIQEFWADAAWHMIRSFEPRLDSATGMVSLVALDETPMKRLKVSPGDHELPVVIDNFVEITSFLEPRLAQRLFDTLARFSEPASAIDVFRLNSIMFKGDNVVVLKDVHQPRDMFLVGDVSPSLTHFSITPMDEKVGPEGQVTFKTVPPLSGVTWSVEKVPGSSDNVGSISTSGVYTAPEKSELDGTFTRVRVTAKVGDYRQSALVSIVSRDIALNPLVVSMGVESGVLREMSAGTLGDGELVWSIADPSSGSQIVPSNVEFGDKAFKPGPKKDVHILVEEVVVENKSTGSKVSSYVVVTHISGTLTIRYEKTDKPDEVRLRLKHEMDDVPPDENLTLTVVAGSGTVTPNGLFKIDPAGKHKFAVVEALYSIGIFKARGHIILPIPLLDIDKALQVQAKCLEHKPGKP